VPESYEQITGPGRTARWPQWNTAGGKEAPAFRSAFVESPAGHILVAAESEQFRDIR
jgi:hypothetical protein